MAESITEGTLKQWNKKVGDFVKADEEVATIETDKVSAKFLLGTERTGDIGRMGDMQDGLQARSRDRVVGPVFCSGRVKSEQGGGAVVLLLRIKAHEDSLASQRGKAWLSQARWWSISLGKSACLGGNDCGPSDRIVVTCNAHTAALVPMASDSEGGEYLDCRMGSGGVCSQMARSYMRSPNGLYEPSSSITGLLS